MAHIPASVSAVTLSGLCAIIYSFFTSLLFYCNKNPKKWEVSPEPFIITSSSNTRHLFWKTTEKTTTVYLICRPKEVSSLHLWGWKYPSWSLPCPHKNSMIYNSQSAESSFLPSNALYFNEMHLFSTKRLISRRNETLSGGGKRVVPN